MKITAVLILAACLQVSANGHGQSVTISKKNAELKDVFRDVEKQTSYQFFYKEKVLDGASKVSIDVKNASLDQVLSICFKDQALGFTIVDKIIVVTPKSGAQVPSPLEKGFRDEVRDEVLPIDIKGHIVNEAGEPIAGASISIKGSKPVVGTTTSTSGEFTLPSVPESATLIFSGTNIETFEIPCSAFQPGVVKELTAKIKVSSLNEVIINKGYYSEKQKYSVGNVGRITAKDIEKQPVSNPLLALQGRVPGLVITQNSGISGGGITVRIQGQNSIQSGNDPLYVVDGVPYFSQLPTTGNDGIFGSSGGNPLNGRAPQGNPLSYLNPADIESIEVLKDADATAIYGSRAANGAILITTKKGKAGKTKVDINLQQGCGKVTRKLEMLNRRQYLDMRYEAYKNDNSTPSLNGFPAAIDLLVWDTTRETNWQKTLIGGTAQYTNINASVSGGSASVQYLIGGTYHRETTVFPFPKDFADEKASVHFNLNSVSANQKFKIQMSANYMVDNNQLPGTDLTQQAIWLEPIAPDLYNADGSLNWAPDATGNSTWDNPLIPKYMMYKNKTSNLVSNAILSYQLLPGLSFSSSFGYTIMQTNDFNQTPLTVARPENQPYTSRRASYGNRTMNTWIIEPQMTYKKNIGKGKLEALIGTSIQQSRINASSISGSGYNSDLVLEDIKAASSLSTNYSYVSLYKYNAAFGRLNYNWQDKYILNLTARRDGSSRFGSNNHFHNFGSVGAGWIFSDEHWLQKQKLFSFGKLRGSFGTTGNDQLEDYKFMNLYNTVGNIQVPYQNITSLEPGGLSNPYLQWEETRKFQMGIDLGFINDRIMFSATYAHNRSSNQLIPTAVPTVTGFQNYTNNFQATVQNTSWEFLLTTTNIKTKNITWTSSLNLTKPNNKLVEFPNIETSTYASGFSGVIIGQPLGVNKTYHFLDVDPTTGLYRFSDKNGTASSTPVFPSDYTVLVSTLPKFYGGFQNSISCKGFQLDFLVQFVKQIGVPVLFNNGSFIAPGSYFLSGFSNQPVSILNRWQNPGDKVLIEKFTASPFGQVANQVSWVKSSDASFADASYIRLKNISLSWQLPMKWQQSAHLQNCRLYIQAQNLLTITNYQGMDPENQSTNSLPPLRVITVGLQMGL